MSGLPVPAHDAYATFEGWIDALLLALPETNAPYPSSVVDWRDWARQIPLCTPFDRYMVPGAETAEKSWRDWVDDLRMEVS